MFRIPRSFTNVHVSSLHVRRSSETQRAFLHTRLAQFFRDILYIRFGWIAPRRTSFVFGFAAAMFETCCGLCLCVPNLAYFSALHLILLHVAILASVVGANTYQPIWPWNILCIILLYNLFVSNQRNENFWGVPSVSSLSECLVLCLEICLFLIGPLLSWIELWPPNLSFQMHSYNFADVRMIVNGKDFPFSDVALNYHTQPSLTFRGFSMWLRNLRILLSVMPKLE